MKEFWNERYASSEYVYGKEPNGFFKEIIDGLAPGKILLPAEGEGRNAVYAAKKGWEVEAFDLSDEGKPKALTLAAQNNVTISYQIASVENFELKENYYDTVGLVYSHLAPELRTQFHHSLADCLKKDGIIFMEAFNKKQINRNSGGPKNIEMLYSVDVLKKDFSNLEIELLEEFEKEIKESKSHSGMADIIHLIARKK